MNNEERLKITFEALSKLVGFEVEPNKKFYITKNGKKEIYLIDDFLNFLYKGADGYFGISKYNISRIFKGELQLEEIKEPLITEEERNFLKQFEFETLEISNRLYMFDKNGRVIISIELDTINFSFDGLGKGKKYSVKELEL